MSIRTSMKSLLARVALARDDATFYTHTHRRRRGGKLADVIVSPSFRVFRYEDSDNADDAFNRCVDVLFFNSIYRIHRTDEAPLNIWKITLSFELRKSNDNERVSPRWKRSRIKLSREIYASLGNEASAASSRATFSRIDKTSGSLHLWPFCD